MVTELNNLAELIALDSLPLWLRRELEQKRDEILDSLEREGFFVLEGPEGQRVEIRTGKKKEAAA